MDSAMSKQILRQPKGERHTLTGDRPVLLVDEHSDLNIFRMKEKKKELSKQFKATEKVREKVRS